MGDNERSAQVFRIDQLVLLTFDLFWVTGLGDETGFAVLTLEVRVFNEVTVALNATISKLYDIMEFFNQREKMFFFFFFYFENYFNDDGVLINALDDDTALQFNHSILLLQSVHASR